MNTVNSHLREVIVLKDIQKCMKSNKSISLNVKCKMVDFKSALIMIFVVQFDVKLFNKQMDYHIARNHTLDGIGAKFESETKLASFLTLNEISFDRDWINFITFLNCKNIEGKKMFARPDFYLHAKSIELNAIVFVGNDEFQHRQYKCDFQRLWNIVHALQQNLEFKDTPIVYIRMNPHFYQIGEKYFDPPLTQVHEKLLHTLNSLTKRDIKHHVNLIYINYSRLANGELCVFLKDKTEPNDYADLYNNCVILSV